MNPEENQLTKNINVDKIVANIKKEAASLNHPSSVTIRKFKNPKKIIKKILKTIRLIFQKNNKYSYELKDLMLYEDEIFIRNVYRALLIREVDQYGLKVNLDKLRSGRASKIDIITRILLSAEGEQWKVKVRGLAPYLLINLVYEIPLFGYILKVSSVIIKLPQIINKLQSYQYNVNSLDAVNNHQAAEILTDHSLDKLYLKFENQFRGPKEEIFKRQHKYINLIKNLEREKYDTVLDLGCGRGEWLQILTENGIKSLGVDTNTNMVKSCIENKVEAVVDDFMFFLEKTSPNTYLAITGFQVVEHIPFPSLIKLLNLCFSALKPGGLVIFETPNPENLIVGACNFYTDPTHLNPIPPRTLQFYIQSQGFIEAKIISSPRKKIKITDAHIEEFYNRWINIDPNYAVTARKSNI